MLTILMTAGTYMPGTIKYYWWFLYAHTQVLKKKDKRQVREENRIRKL